MIQFAQRLDQQRPGRSTRGHCTRRRWHPALVALLALLGHLYRVLFPQSEEEGGERDDPLRLKLARLCASRAYQTTETLANLTCMQSATYGAQISTKLTSERCEIIPTRRPHTCPGFAMKRGRDQQPSRAPDDVPPPPPPSIRELIVKIGDKASAMHLTNHLEDLMVKAIIPEFKLQRSLIIETVIDCAR